MSTTTTTDSVTTTARAERLYYRYARAVDEGNLDELRALATPDVKVTRGGGETKDGIEAFLDVYRAHNALQIPVCKHVITNITAEPEAADGTVVTHAYFEAKLLSDAETKVIIGYYEDVHVVEGDEHRLAHKKIVAERVLMLPASAGSYSYVGQKQA
ncbi:MAG TPA: nuclear transport factor 2 family protein [Lapillicoccus sp.]|nr:nuclear transport factor 2 family protein [Lapillicoccus sp.]